MTPRRILMTTDTVGGVWSHALELCGALEEQGIEVALASMGRLPTHGQREEVRRLSNVELFASEHRLEWMEEPWADVDASGEWLLGIAARFEPEVVHLNGFAHGALPWEAPKLVVGHSCVCSWWEEVHGTQAGAEWNCYRDRVAAGLRAADKVIAPSQAMLEALARNYGPFADSAVIPNGISAGRKAARSKENFILAAGRIWDPAKNTSRLADISSRLLCPVLVAGRCEERANMGAMRCLGELPRRELFDWQGRAAIFAAPAKYEPFGLCILEAAAAGCALALGDIPSLRENWDGAAEFVHPDDSSQWIERLNRLARDRGRRERFGRLARARAGQFTAERMAAGYLAAYSDLLGARMEVEEAVA